MPDTPSTMFDHTVSWSLPIGVTNPMPVTATRRRPLECELMLQPAYGPGGQKTSAPCGKRPSELWTRSPRIRRLEQLPQADRQLQPKPGWRLVQVAAEQLAEPVQAVEHGVAVELQLRGRVLDRAAGQVRLERLHQLLAVARRGFEQRAQRLTDEPLGEHRVLGHEQVGDHLVVPV